MANFSLRLGFRSCTFLWLKVLLKKKKKEKKEVVKVCWVAAGDYHPTLILALCTQFLQKESLEGDEQYFCIYVLPSNVGGLYLFTSNLKHGSRYYGEMCHCYFDRCLQSSCMRTHVNMCQDLFMKSLLCTLVLVFATFTFHGLDLDCDSYVGFL